jgi:hypothetical protein
LGRSLADRVKQQTPPNPSTSANGNKVDFINTIQPHP